MINVMALVLNYSESKKSEQKSIPVFRITHEDNRTENKDYKDLIKTLNLKYKDKHVILYSRMNDDGKKMATLELNSVRVNAGPKYIMTLDDLNKKIIPLMVNDFEDDYYFDIKKYSASIKRKIIKK